MRRTLPAPVGSRTWRALRDNLGMVAAFAFFVAVLLTLGILFTGFAAVVLGASGVAALSTWARGKVRRRCATSLNATFDGRR
jgi:hypothetical protein